MFEGALEKRLGIKDAPDGVNIVSSTEAGASVETMKDMPTLLEFTLAAAQSLDEVIKEIQRKYPEVISNTLKTWKPLVVTGAIDDERLQLLSNVSLGVEVGIFTAGVHSIVESMKDRFDTEELQQGLDTGRFTGRENAVGDYKDYIDRRRVVRNILLTLGMAWQAPLGVEMLLNSPKSEDGALYKYAMHILNEHNAKWHAPVTLDKVLHEYLLARRVQLLQRATKSGEINLVTDVNAGNLAWILDSFKEEELIESIAQIVVFAAIFTGSTLDESAYKILQLQPYNSAHMQKGWNMTPLQDAALKEALKKEYERVHNVAR